MTGRPSSMSPRPLDHLVLPTADLAVARERLVRLGFTVAPEGVHPFGTRNVCVYFADGTFIEPLALGDADVAAEAAASGNSFVLGDRRFRAARGEEGFAALVFGTGDAAADHEEFGRLGVAGGDMVEFSRPSLDMQGRADTATFRLAFAGNPAARDLFFFTCERRRAPKIDRSALERHANGAARILSVTAAAEDAQGFAAFLATVARGAALAADHGAFDVALANAGLRVLPCAGKGVRLTEIVYGVPDPGAVAALFKAAAIGYETRANALCVPAMAGQGADFIFEEFS